MDTIYLLLIPFVPFSVCFIYAMITFSKEKKEKQAAEAKLASEQGQI